MGRYLGLSTLALLFAPGVFATLAVDYSPIKGVSQDGNCGSIKGMTCMGSVFGNCCSLDGTCGATDSHCGDGCQPLFGVCPESVLKKYAEEAAALEKREIEARATSTLACRSATAASIVCVPSKTSVIRAAGSPTAFCKSWNAAKPHATSPFTAQGILLPVGVDNACNCILADTSSASKSLTISLEQKAATTTPAITCVPSKTSVIRAAGTPTSFCKSWNAVSSHASSPFTAQGILQPIGVSNACSCILADTVYIQTVRPTLSSSSSVVCVPAKTSVIRAAGSATSFCSSWNAAKPHSSSPFTAQGILQPVGVDNACNCILADTGYVPATTTAATTNQAAVTSTKSTASACTLRRRRRRNVERGFAQIPAPTSVGVIAL